MICYLGVNSLQGWIMAGQGEVVLSWGREDLGWLSRGSSLLWEWWGAGTGCPERLWMPHPWRCSRPAWMGAWAAWSSIKWGGWWPCLWWGSWRFMILEVPSNPGHSVILWFTVNGYLCAKYRRHCPRQISSSQRHTRRYAYETLWKDYNRVPPSMSFNSTARWRYRQKGDCSFFLA